jgi:hypothetical protein
MIVSRWDYKLAVLINTTPLSVASSSVREQPNSREPTIERCDVSKPRGNNYYAFAINVAPFFVEQHAGHSLREIVRRVEFGAYHKLACLINEAAHQLPVDVYTDGSKLLVKRTRRIKPRRYYHGSSCIDITEFAVRFVEGK